ncbi:amino acid transporter [Sistotremastrum suecicum HHB10207 ss-3]|uniref:Amino acid transporter n=1 Tax=Sistotremastrum suecicum HHB10207 ss-3 TaxID=1314776 RepID=A0A166FQE1_9AGAM|nr:amino acid transporter [Sistotremastrum suecicum HHB10207 ss-3]
MDDIIENDDKRLETLGIHRELQKEFTNFSTTSFAFGIMGCAATIASTFNNPILLGGPTTAVWAWLLGSVGCLCIAASVSELVSAYPTSGGIYTSTAFVVPGRYRASVTFIAAWVTFVGQLATPSSVAFALAQMIFAAVTIGTDGAFVASKGQLLGLYVGINVALGLLNSLPTKVLHRVSKYYVWVNMLTTLVVIIAIPAAGRGNLASSKSVWASVDDRSGWSNNGFSLLLGLLCVQWVMTDYDAAAHISEEVKNAAVAAPVAIFTAAAVTAVLGFFVNISLCYGIRDLSALPGPTGLVFSQILWDNLGRSGGLVVWSFVIIVQTMVGATCQLAAVRTIYAVSRDNALPDRKILSKIWRTTGTPVNAVIFLIIIQTLFGLLYLASFVAVNAIFSITAVALDVSYMIPVAAKLWIYFNPESDVKFEPGPFYMGRWGYLVNLYAVTWTLFETGILVMPQVLPVTANTMNYTGPIVFGVCGLSWIWYKLYWHRFYQVPGGQRLTDIYSESAPSQDEKVETESRDMKEKSSIA